MTRRHGEVVQVALVFLMLLAVFFWRAIFLGQKLVPGDIIYTDPVYSGYTSLGLTNSEEGVGTPYPLFGAQLAYAHNTLLYDQAYQFYPWRVYTVQALQQGFLPMWNPYIYCGAPFMAADQPAVFYPLNVLAYPFSAADAALVTALARLLIAGLTTYWFLRTIGAGKFGALLGGISYAFGGFMIVFLGHPHTNVAALLPALFLTLEWLYRRSSAQHIAWVALVTAAQLTGGHAELCLYTLAAGGLYYLFRIVSAWRRQWDLARWAATHPVQTGAPQARAAACGAQVTAPLCKRHVALGTDAERLSLVRQILSFGLAMLLGFALAAMHVLPFLEWLQQNAELDLRLATKGAHAVRVGLRHWLAGIPLMILPNLFGNPTWPGDYQSVLPFWNFVEQTVYVGIVALAVAIAPAIGWLQSRLRRDSPSGRCWPESRRRRWDTPALFMGLLALIALGAALRWPVFDWVNQLPLFSIAAPGRLRLIYMFSASVLAGLGASRLSAGRDENSITRGTRGSLVGLAALATATLVLVRWILERAAGSSPQEAGTWGELTLGAVQWAFGLANLDMYWPVLIALAAFVVLVLYQRRAKCPRQLGPLSHRAMQALVLLLVVVDLFAFGMDFHTTVRQELIFPETPTLRLLQSDQDLFRLVGTNIDLMPNSAMIYGLQDVRGLDFPDSRYLELCEAMGGQDRLGYGIVFTEQLQPALLGLMNVKYVLTSSDLDEKLLSHLTLLAVDKDIRVYQNRDFLPRSFIVHRVRTVGDAKEALAALQAPDLHLSDEIVLEEPLPDSVSLPGWGPEEKIRTGNDICQITRYDPNHVTVTASSSANGFLFLSDRYDRGWKAFVDGVEADIYRADYVFRAVYLTAGQHAVDFVYAPRSFALALPITLLAALILVILLGSSWLQKRFMRMGGPAEQSREGVSNGTP